MWTHLVSAASVGFAMSSLSRRPTPEQPVGPRLAQRTAGKEPTFSRSCYSLTLSEDDFFPFYKGNTYTDSFPGTTKQDTKGRLCCYWGHLLLPTPPFVSFKIPI